MLDTNVLLSHLKLISELKDFPIEGKYAFGFSVITSQYNSYIYLCQF